MRHTTSPAARGRSALIHTLAAAAACLALTSLAADAGAQTARPGARDQRRVTFNGGTLDERGRRVLTQLETLGGARLPDGDYWYDPAAGVAGRWGGPAAVLLIPGLPLGGRLPANASGGGNGRLTGIFVNGRELHPSDVRALIAAYGQAWPGRWWVNGRGDFGAEGGPAIGNLRQAAAAARGGPWQRGTGAGSNGFWTGGDGNGYVWAMDGYSGCSYASDGGGVIC
jgi:hypothetical protein